MMINAGAIMPRPGYLESLRLASNTVLIFDEVITGFRLALGGAAERFGVIPDLATYGKAIAAGWPVAAIAGRRELMREFGTGRINHSGTFNASVMGAAAALATVTYLREHSPYEQVGECERLMSELPKLATEAGHQLHVQGLPMAFTSPSATPTWTCTTTTTFSFSTRPATPSWPNSWLTRVYG